MLRCKVQGARGGSGRRGGVAGGGLRALSLTLPQLPTSRSPTPSPTMGPASASSASSTGDRTASTGRAGSGPG